MINSEKQRLRLRMRELFRSHQTDDFELHRRALVNHPSWKAASTILLYSALPGEPDPRSLLNEHDGITRQFPRRFLFPRIEGDSLGIYLISDESRWINGPFGLQEPDPESWEKASLREIDLAFIPGLAFDIAGGRLGRGKGFYDRLLGDPQFRGLKVGLCWEWQLLPEIPREAHDIVMDLIITEERIVIPRLPSSSSRSELEKIDISTETE